MRKWRGKNQAQTDSDIQPVDADKEKADTRDSAAMAGLKRIVGRIKDYPQRYTDDSGAQFIRDYYDKSPERALGFFKRIEKDGFRVELNPEEEELMEKIRPRTSPLGLLPQARIVDGAAATLTRRNLLRKGGYVLGALALDQASHGVSQKTKEIGDVSKDLVAVQEELDREGLSVKEREALAAKREALKQKLKTGAMGKVAGLAYEHPALLTTLGIIGYQTVKQGMDVYDHANQKADKVINFVSGVIDHKMGYTVVPPESGRGGGGRS